MSATMTLRDLLSPGVGAFTANLDIPIKRETGKVVDSPGTINVPEAYSGGGSANMFRSGWRS